MRKKIFILLSMLISHAIAAIGESNDVTKISSVLAVSSFTLVNADTDNDRSVIKESDAIRIYPGEKINIRYNPRFNPSSVTFFLNGAKYSNENSAPFALAGDLNGDYKPWYASEGFYTLTAREYARPKGTGTLLAVYTVHFFIKKEPGITILNHDFETPVDFNNPQSPWRIQAFIPEDAIVLWGANIGRNNSGGVSIEAPNDALNDISVAQTIRVVPGKTYRLSTWVKTENVHGEYGANICLLGAFERSAPPVVGTTDWQKISFEFTAPSSGVVDIAVRLGFYSGVATGKAYFDDVRIEEAASTFTLVNAITDTDRERIRDNDTLSIFPGEKINIRYDASANPSSVTFLLNGAVFKNENSVPFALAGDNNGNYNPWNVSEGYYTLTAREYSKPNGTGTLLDVYTVHFYIKKEPAFTIINGNFETPVDFYDVKSPWVIQAFIPQDAVVVWGANIGRDNSGGVSIEAPNGALNDISVAQTIRVAPGKTYRLSTWVKTENVQGEYGANVCLYGGFERSAPVFGTTDSWKMISFEFTAPASGEVIVAVRLGFFSGVTTGKAYFDDVTIEEVVQFQAAAKVALSPENYSIISKCYPNPSYGSFQINIQPEEDGDGNVSIYNANGRQVAELFHGTLEKGQTFEFKWDASGLMPGLYFLKVITNEKEFVEKLIVK